MSYLGAAGAVVRYQEPTWLNYSSVRPSLAVSRGCGSVQHSIRNPWVTVCRSEHRQDSQKCKLKGVYPCLGSIQIRLQRGPDQLRDFLMDALIIVIGDVMSPMPAVHLDRQELHHLFHLLQVVEAPGHHFG